MSKLVTALLVRNEADKYLERVLTRCWEFSDSVALVDDNSTDGSGDLARAMGCTVIPRSGESMWGAEAPARAELWDHAARLAGDGWVVICDADMILHGDPRPLCLTTFHTAWAWPLYDMWTDRYYRCDGYWQGHLHPRPWMFRPSALKDPPKWPQRGIHTGHCPVNFELNVGIPSPIDREVCGVPSLYWEHLAYSTPEARVRKHALYMLQAHQLTDFEYGHANSILD